MNIVQVKLTDRYPIAGVNDYCIMMLSRDIYYEDIKELSDAERMFYPFPRHVIFGDLKDLNKPLITMYDNNFEVKNDIYYGRHSLVNENGYAIYAPTVAASVWNDHITVLGYDRTRAFNLSNMLYTIISDIMISEASKQGNEHIHQLKGVLKLYFMADMVDKDKTGYTMEEIVRTIYERFYERYGEDLPVDFYLVEK